MRAYPVSDAVSGHPDDGKRNRAMVLMKRFAVRGKEQRVVHLRVVFVAAITIVCRPSHDMKKAPICWVGLVASDAFEIEEFFGAFEDFNRLRCNADSNGLRGLCVLHHSLQWQ